jgi:hypothetical protein
MPFHVRPFACQDAIYHAIAHRTVAASQMMANDAIFFGAQGLNRALRSEVEIVRAEADNFASYLEEQFVLIGYR